MAISLCDFDEKEYAAAIEKLTGKRMKVVQDHPYPMQQTAPAPKVAPPAREPRNRPKVKKI
ncbi:hypothetical protein HMSSN139_00470 [Paenibacillus sp. HMSSN-139]|nr:hypothetical protein HMSSN139_00470 [Paenibacillus sp. HMSSN-139]